MTGRSKYRPETDLADLADMGKAVAIAESIGIKVEKSWGLGRVVTGSSKKWRKAI